MSPRAHSKRLYSTSFTDNRQRSSPRLALMVNDASENERKVDAMRGDAWSSGNCVALTSCAALFTHERAAHAVSDVSLGAQSKRLYSTSFTDNCRRLSTLFALMVNESSKNERKVDVTRGGRLIQWELGSAYFVRGSFSRTKEPFTKEPRTQ